MSKLPAVLFVNPLIVIELVLVLMVGLLAFYSPRFGDRWFRPAEKAFHKLAQKRRLAILVIGLLVLVGRAALLPLLPLKEPKVHDEFSYLLAADTFASGRLTNPTHPMWEHFETFHVIHRPTYMSMYPPAQGLVLAAGKAIAEHPWAGVWLSVSLMSAAVCWMLQAWLPPTWALLGGVMAAIRIGIFSYWMTSYYGGAAAATGGALVLGALPRILRWQRLGDALLMGAGLAILANSRPYEGFVLSLPVAGILLAWTLKRKWPSLRLALLHVVLPISLVLGATTAAMGYYFWRVTGDPFRMPFVENWDAYGTNNPLTATFSGEAATEKVSYNHEVMRDYYTKWLREFQRPAGQPPIIAAAVNLAFKVQVFWAFYFGPILSLPMIFLPKAFRDRRLRPLVWVAVACVVGLVLEAWMLPHYWAPIASVVIVFLLQSMRHLRVWRWRAKPTGLLLTRAIPTVCILMMPVALVAQWGQLLAIPDWPHYWCCDGPGNLDRAAISRQLEEQGGHHLVIVRYKSEHNPNEEWVYNRADIDRAKIVWAREMDPALNEKLIRYFKDRRVWLVEPDEIPPKLSLYPVCELP